MMTTGAREKQSSAQVLTEAMAATILRRYQQLWNRAALTELLSGFTDDIVVEFADLPRINGKAELESMLKARLARQKGNRREETLRAVTGTTIVGTWIADWVEATTGRPMKGRGIEFIEMRDDKCTRREATFNAWDAEGPRSSLFT